MFTRRSRRSFKAALFIGFCTVATALALIALAAILASLLVEGVGGLNLQVFTHSTPAPGSEGGGDVGRLAKLLRASSLAIPEAGVALVGDAATTTTPVSETPWTSGGSRNTFRRR